MAEEKATETEAENRSMPHGLEIMTDNSYEKDLDLQDTEESDQSAERLHKSPQIGRPRMPRAMKPISKVSLPV